MNSGATVKIRGGELPIAFGLWAWFEAEKKYGSEKAMESMLGHGFELLLLQANQARVNAKQQPDITADWLVDNITPKQAVKAVQTAKDVLLHAMQSEQSQNDDEEVDEVQEELQRKNAKPVTPRRVMAFAMIAGMTADEAMRSSPGFILDMYLVRQAYDDALHGVKRKSKTRWEE